MHEAVYMTDRRPFTSGRLTKLIIFVPLSPL